ncbi:MAG: glycosyltransferase family 2 protein [Bacteroidetes Order II. Incertae sedis bacterium]|nr:glycosyltransferase family 2 protein [Bacteroidetes Order II. bacterium]MBT5248843.1 glycosyltransferase family 2 protein [Bacteroidetes Order II. bacterium]MBT6199179.1 glycosyltransferase family 2 protein [Bacteroidetes Order II. bacterium]MBT6423887.1 glycosyltransferase family 2 protein [Bacteroidetes Order II. bacterium]MBT6580730.1 glycosyltransferase family 2 protein [Bacteroidetes Order II. bacterium]
MARTPYISILIVSWNALETVKKCLPSIVATQYDSFEILFVDNASEDGSAQWVEDTFPSVRIVRHPENWAFCRGNNEAVAHAKGEVLVILNNDVEVPPDWLTPLAQTFKTDSSVGAAQPKLHQFDDRSMFEYAGAAGGFLDRDGYPFTRGRLFETMEIDQGQYDQDTDIFWASGTCLAIRKDVFESLGGFEESFFMHMEEIDLCWRLRSRGWRIVLVPASVIYHLGGASLAKGNQRKTYLNFRNNLLMLYRNLPPAEWNSVFLRRVLLDGIAMLRALILLRPSESWAILRAYADAHKMKSAHKDVRPLPGKSAALPYRRSIVVDHFIRGVKRFSDLSKDAFHDL